ncbi:hypothetical protein F4802DRAFT_615953 [Xylaria palmicola]|nr:hypothetical protein F4802DRAFT_615953 [Xylaria palmicola]
MPRPSFRDILRLPPATAVFLLSAVFDLTGGHALPRQTKVVQLRELDVIAFPPMPTGEPPYHFGHPPRQENTICGYLGGNPDLPATCSLGSHCVLDPANSVVGCCPNGGACTTGVFTGCVDRHNEPQTEINPYVFTCQGNDVCFKNNFAGGYFQYGCGTASELGTTVQTSANGATTALSIETVDVSLTGSPTSLTIPTTIGSSVSTETSSSDQISSLTTSESLSSMVSQSSITTDSSVSSSSILSTPPTSSNSATSTTSSRTSRTSRSSSRTSSHSTTSRTRSSSSRSSTHSRSTTSHPPFITASPTPTGVEDPQSAKQSQTGAIIGGVVGGAAAAISLVALVFFCLRRRNRNHRIGPGPTPSPPPATQYTGPMQSHGAAFAPLPSWHEHDDEASSGGHSHPEPPEPYGPLEPTHAGPSSTLRNPPNPPPLADPHGPLEPALSAPAPANLGAGASAAGAARGFSQPLRYNPAYMPIGMSQPKGSLTPVAEEDQSMEREEPPQGREIDDFSRAYSSAGIGQLADDDVEEDRAPLRRNEPRGTPEDGSPSRRPVGHRPLWQQNRQQSRNLMWL